jgi:hypothetical protein
MVGKEQRTESIGDDLDGFDDLGPNMDGFGDDDLGAIGESKPKLTKSQARKKRDALYKTKEPFEDDVAEDIKDFEKSIRARVQDENSRLIDAGDSEYYICVCFQNRDQKEKFLRHMQWDKYGDKYLDGTQIALDHGLDMTKEVPAVRKERMNKNFANLT